MVFVAYNFDNPKTMHRRERTLLGDLRMAYRDRNEKEFLNLLHRTGYKNTEFNDQMFSNNILVRRCCLQHFKTSRNLLFEHDINESLFEEVLRTPGAVNSRFITLIWTECDLWRNQDILLTVNPLGKQLIDYIIESNDDENLFAFLVFDFECDSETVSKSSKKYFLKIKNEQFLRKTGKSLFQKFYAILDSDCEGICFDIMEKLLREMKKIVDIKGETAIDEVLKMQNKIHKHRILKLCVMYWKVNSKEYDHYKAVLSELSPYFKLIFMLKECRELEFEDYFPIYIGIMKEKHGNRHSSKVQNDFNSLLEFALRHSQPKAIKIIINCPLIDVNKVAIKSDDAKFNSQYAHLIMSKLLERGYYLGYDDERRVPSDWISAKVFENFLDSRVQEDGKIFQINNSCIFKIFKEEMKLSL